MPTKRVIQLLRSNNVYNGFEKAKEKLTSASFSAARKDGEVVLARYGNYDPNTDSDILANGTMTGTAIGVYFVPESGDRVRELRGHHKPCQRASV